jgi:hypothetical protein
MSSKFTSNGLIQAVSRTRDCRERPCGIRFDEKTATVDQVGRDRAARVDTTSRPIFVDQPKHDVSDSVREAAKCECQSALRELTQRVAGVRLLSSADEEFN